MMQERRRERDEEHAGDGENAGAPAAGRRPSLRVRPPAMVATG